MGKNLPLQIHQIQYTEYRVNFLTIFLEHGPLRGPTFDSSLRQGGLLYTEEGVVSVGTTSPWVHSSPSPTRSWTHPVHARRKTSVVPGRHQDLASPSEPTPGPRSIWVRLQWTSKVRSDRIRRERCARTSEPLWTPRSKTRRRGSLFVERQREGRHTCRTEVITPPLLD